METPTFQKNLSNLAKSCETHQVIFLMHRKRHGTLRSCDQFTPLCSADEESEYLITSDHGEKKKKDFTRIVACAPRTNQWKHLASHTWTDSWLRNIVLGEKQQMNPELVTLQGCWTARPSCEAPHQTVFSFQSETRRTNRHPPQRKTRCCSATPQITGSCCST